MSHPKYILSAFLMILVTVGGLSSTNLQVETRFGIVQGKFSKTVRGRLVANFLGIPYAYPPLGHRRFRSPVPLNLTWETPYYALSDSLMCAQLDRKGNVIGSEDCLYLNIFVPLVSDDSGPPNNLPVMFYIHGGAFNMGSSDSHKISPNYLLDQDIIFVTVNYRLNALGFFSTTNKASPGNYGIKDILSALKWVKENIGDFGGDANMVTLAGHSAGATAAHLLVLSKSAEGLFHRCILQGGSAMVPLGVHSHRFIRRASLEMAELAGCRSPLNTSTSANETNTTNWYESQRMSEGQWDDWEELDEPEDVVQRDEEMMECMRGVPAKELLLQTGYYPIWKGNPYCVFGPTIEEPSEDAVVTMHPLTAIKNHEYPDIPMIFGIAEDEGLVKTIKFYVDFEAEKEMIDNFDLYLPYALEYHEVVPNFTAFSRAVEEFYFDGNISTQFCQNITKIVGDALIIWPVYRAAKLHSQHTNSSIYFYRFSYQGTFTNTFSIGIPKHYGVAHGDEMNYLFPKLNYKFRDQLLHNTEDDTTMINVMTEMWAAFVTYGVPTAWMTPIWPNFAEAGQLMRFGLGKSPDLQVEDEFLPKRMMFWQNITSTLIEEPMGDESMIDPRKEQEIQTDFAATCHSNKLLLLSTLLIIILGVYRIDFN